MDAVPYQPPGAEYWFGTDNYGRDVLCAGRMGDAPRADGRGRLVRPGHRRSASSLGSLSGYYGGWIDALLSRTFDLFLLIPTFFLVLLIIALFGSSITLTMLAIAVTTWPKSARIMRSQVLSLKSRVYVQSARAAGASNLPRAERPRRPERPRADRHRRDDPDGRRHPHRGGPELPRPRRPERGELGQDDLRRRSGSFGWRHGSRYFPASAC